VQIEKKQHRNIPIAPAVTSRSAHMTALQQAALFPTRLALARWTRGGDIPHVFAAASKPGRAAWFDHAQDALQSWLDAGGFHQIVMEYVVCEGMDPNLVCPLSR
jgi:hypothetical protein